MSRQLGLDLASVLNVAPALQKSSRVTQRTGLRDGDAAAVLTAAAVLGAALGIVHFANVFGFLV